MKNKILDEIVGHRNVPLKAEKIELMAPVKSEERVLSITETTRPYFEQQLALTALQQK